MTDKKKEEVKDEPKVKDDDFKEGMLKSLINNKPNEFADFYKKAVDDKISGVQNHLKDYIKQNMFNTSETDPDKVIDDYLTPKKDDSTIKDEDPKDDPTKDNEQLDIVQRFYKHVVKNDDDDENLTDPKKDRDIEK